MEEMIHALLEWDNAEIFLTILTILFLIYSIFLYIYKRWKLNMLFGIEELKIKRDVIADVNIENKSSDKELVEKIINFDITNKHMNSGLKVEDKYIYELINLHHKQALQQSNIQFWFSIVAAIIGFVFIILIILLSKSNEWYDYIFKIIPGTIIEAISVLFINQARETRDKATKFFTELNYQMQIEKSVEIADTIERDEIRSEVKSKIALHIIGIENDTNKKDV